MKKLTIGELSSLLGIPPSTMRFYESRAMVSPEKNFSNSYRAYSADESCRFLMVKRFQSLGFSLAEASALIDSPDGSSLGLALAERKAALEAELDRLRTAIECLGGLKDDWETSQALGAAFLPARLEARRCLFTREAGIYRREVGRRRLARAWMRRLPRLAYICQIQAEGFLGLEAPVCRWGYALPLDDSLGDPEPFVEAQGASDTLMTGLERRGSVDFTAEELASAREAFRATGREMAGPLTATFLGMRGGPKDPVYLYRLDIPVKT